MRLLGLGFIVFVIGIGGFVVWLVALVDMLRRPVEQWQASGQDRIVWALVVVLLYAVGAILYWFIARPQLESERV